MWRWAVGCLCVGVVWLCAGCGGQEKATNPSNLEYSKEGPPKRDGAQPGPGGKKQ